MKKKVAVVGGGAAGFFFAINLANRSRDLEIVILEKTTKVLSKVKVSGGGRCNVTNGTFHNSKLVDHYPRGKSFLKRVFQQFSTKDTIDWFAQNGVTLKQEPDNRIFPITDSSQTIINCFLDLVHKHAIQIRYGTEVQNVQKVKEGYLVNSAELFDYLYVAIGGSAKREAYEWVSRLDHTIIEPLPSLFTFNIPHSPLKGLEGVALSSANVRIEKSDLKANGAVLVTHWGLSGPAILRLSAWGAVHLNEQKYCFNASVNTVSVHNPEVVRAKVLEFKELNRLKQVSSHRLFDLPSRFWERVVQLSDILEDQKWGDISQQKVNKLIEHLTNFQIHIVGKTTFKEEFVTCGGVALEEVNAQSMESLLHPNLFFGGEVLDIDGITGGFNFQAAWSTAWIAAKTIASRNNPLDK